VWWLYTPHGGYGYNFKVPAFVHTDHGKHVSIAAQKKDGTFKVVRVGRSKLSRRDAI
jgi:fructose/tagatose bisphosphate aldolase